MEKLRLFVDMDGTLNKFKSVDTLETLYEEGYFRNLRPNEKVLQAVKNIIYIYPEIEVYVMSAVFTDSKYALAEKNEWLDKYLPQIDQEHRIFPPCGKNKLEYVPGGIRPTDHLLDDYTKNLVLWEPPAKGIKLLNGINHTNETWQGNMLRFDKSADILAEDIVKIMKEKAVIHDTKPQEHTLYSITRELKKVVDALQTIETIPVGLDIREPKTVENRGYGTEPSSDNKYSSSNENQQALAQTASIQQRTAKAKL